MFIYGHSCSVADKINFLKLIRTTNYTNCTNSYFRKYEGL